jgi:Glycosyltransferase family 87
VTTLRARLDGPTRVVLAVLAAIVLASAIRNIKEEGDFRGYLEVGELVLRGADIYAEARPDVNTWPPLFAVVCVPLALLARVSVYLARVVWLAVNLGCIVAMLRLAVALVYRRPLVLERGSPTGVALVSAAVLGPLVLSARFFLGNLDRLQINMLILTACLAGACLLTRGRAVAGGALIGVAAAVKVLPIFFVPYFAWKRWWTTCAAAVGAGALASLAPILVFGPERFAAYTRHWIALSAGSWPVRKGNQSVYAMVDRLYTHGAIIWSPSQTRLTAANDPMVAAIVWGSFLAVALAFGWVSRRGGRTPVSAAATVEVAIVLCLAVLWSPLAWKHYFVFLLLGQCALWRAAFGDGYGLPAPTRRRIAWLLGLSYVLTTLTVRGVVGKHLSLTLETMSAVTLGALVVLAALLLLRGALARAEG